MVLHSHIMVILIYIYMVYYILILWSFSSVAAWVTFSDSVDYSALPDPRSGPGRWKGG